MFKNTLSEPIDQNRSSLSYKDIFIYGVILISFLCFFVPFYSLMPDKTLDQSWAFALNTAVGQKLRFGQDIIWTYGPYASIITRQFHPDTFLFMILGSMFMAVAYSICIFAIYKNRKDVSAIIISLLGFLLIHEEIIHTSYILILSFVLLENPPGWTKKYFLHFFLASVVGLSCLTKLTITYSTASYIPIISFYLLSRKKYFLSFIYTFVPLITIVTLWLISGQSLISLKIYFLSSRDIVSGYPEGMSSEGHIFLIYIYLFFSAYILYEIYNSKMKNRFYKILFLLLFFFSTYKMSFTHAFVHEHVAISSAIFIYILYVYFINKKTSFVLLCSSIFILNQTLNIKSQGTALFATRPYRVFGNAWAIKDFYLEKQNALFEESLAETRRGLPLSYISGSVDTYSNKQSYFLAHGLKVDFKPIMQSYSAYTPELIRANSHHLKTKKPDNVFIDLEPIFLDGQDITNTPLLLDGLSFKTLFNMYQPAALITQRTFAFETINNKPIKFLHLIRRENPPIINSVRPIKREMAFRNEEITVPTTNNPLFVTFNFEKSFWGHALIFLYKMPQLFITATLRSGEKLTYRFVASMAETGFILSPFIETTHELLQLYTIPKQLLEKQVSSFTIRAQGMDWAWLAPYTITWYELPQNSLKETSFTSFNQIYAPLKKMNLISDETLTSWVLHTPTFRQTPILSSFYSRALQTEEPSPWTVIKNSTP